MDYSLKQATYIGTAALIAAVLIFGALAYYEKGYRLNGLRVIAPASVILSNIPGGAKLYIDGREIETVGKEGEVHVTVDASIHDLIVSKEGFWPWEKEVFIPGGDALRINTFLLPTSPEGAPLLSSDPLRRQVDALFARAKLPTRAAPLISGDGKTSLFAEKGNIIARWISEEPLPQYYCPLGECSIEHIITTYDAELRDLAFYPGRSDIALLAIQNGIFALEIDNRGIQNFQPVYRGTRPRMVMKDDVAYLKEGQAVLRLNL